MKSQLTISTSRLFDKRRYDDLWNRCCRMMLDWERSLVYELGKTRLTGGRSDLCRGGDRAVGVERGGGAGDARFCFPTYEVQTSSNLAELPFQ